VSQATFPLIKTAGDPRQRGWQYGYAAREAIHAGLSLYLPVFAARGIDEKRLRELAGEFGARMQTFDSDLTDEMAGIAEGAAVDFEHIVALNARTELLYWQDDGCTTAVCLPEITSEGHVLLCQNWDWRPGTRATSVVLQCVPDSGPSFTTFVEAGLLARSGFNSAGIGTVGNFLETDQDSGRSGIPIALLRRRILMSESLSEAVGQVVRPKRGFSCNYLIADAAGEAISCEAAPDDVYFVQAQDGLISHSNNFCSPAALTRHRDLGIARYPDTLYRGSRLGKLLRASAPNVDVEDIRIALTDHYGLPDSICRHLADRPGDLIVTVASVVMDLTSRQLWLAPGPPCENTYTEYGLGSPSEPPVAVDVDAT